MKLYNSDGFTILPLNNVEHGVSTLPAVRNRLILLFLVTALEWKCLLFVTYQKKSEVLKMQIQREFDKVFRITITEKEAELICDCSVMDFTRSREVVVCIGQALLTFMHDASIEPHAVKHSVEVEL